MEKSAWHKMNTYISHEFWYFLQEPKHIRKPDSQAEEEQVGAYSSYK